MEFHEIQWISKITEKVRAKVVCDFPVFRNFTVQFSSEPTIWAGRSFAVRVGKRSAESRERNRFPIYPAYFHNFYLFSCLIVAPLACFLPFF